MVENRISEDTVKEIYDFVKVRNWSQFHNPKDLAVSISLEAAELLETFQWSGADLDVVQKKAAMEEELADVMIYCVLMSKAIGANMDEIIMNKLVGNGKKYPINKAYGNSAKYTDLEEQQ